MTLQIVLRRQCRRYTHICENKLLHRLARRQKNTGVYPQTTWREAAVVAMAAAAVAGMAVQATPAATIPQQGLAAALAEVGCPGAMGGLRGGATAIPAAASHARHLPRLMRIPERLRANGLSSCVRWATPQTHLLGVHCPQSSSLRHCRAPLTWMPRQTCFQVSGA